MSWWKRLRGGVAPPSSPKCLGAVRLDMPGWTEEANGGDFRVWRDSSSDVLSLSIMDASLDLSEISDEAALQHWSRELQEYGRSWAQDPYEPTYRGVDRRVLRFVSDSDCYDERFPDHPLSKVRRVLAALPNAVRIESPAPESWNAWADQV